MGESMSELEKEIEESRARLDRRIDQIQDRLSPVNLIDEMIGSARRTPAVNGVYDDALAAVRRNPLPVLLIAAGVGLLMRNISTGRSRAAASRKLPVVVDPAPTPIPGSPAERGYDPDQPVGRPARELAAETKA